MVLPALTGNLYRAKALHYSSMTTKTNLSLKERRKEKKLLAAQGKDASATGPDAQPRKAKWNRLDFPTWYASASKLWDDIGKLQRTLEVNDAKRHAGIDSVAEAYGKVGLYSSQGSLANQLKQDADPIRGSRVALLRGQAEEVRTDRPPNTIYR